MKSAWAWVGVVRRVSVRMVMVRVRSWWMVRKGMVVVGLVCVSWGLCVRVGFGVE